MNVLQVQPVSRKLLQLVGVTALLLAAKYEEKAWGIDTPKIQDFANITDNTFTPTQIRDMEQVMLTTLDFELGRPVPLDFLKRAAKATNVSFCPLIERVVITLFTYVLTFYLISNQIFSTDTVL